MSTPEEHLHQELLEYLTRIDDRLGEICEDSPDLGPEEVLAELEHATAGTRDTIDRFVAAIHHEHAPTADLNSILVETSREIAADATIPVVIKTSQDENLPALRHHPEAVQAMVRRALQLCVEHVAPGGMIHVVATLTVDGYAELRLETRGAPDPDPAMSIGLRSASLADILEGLGGSFAMRQDDGRLLFTLGFAVSAGIS